MSDTPAATTTDLDTDDLETIGGALPALGGSALRLMMFLGGLIMNADPFDGNYYGVGA